MVADPLIDNPVITNPVIAEIGGTDQTSSHGFSRSTIEHRRPLAFRDRTLGGGFAAFANRDRTPTRWIWLFDPSDAHYGRGVDHAKMVVAARFGASVRHSPYLAWVL
jgi:hypothetical protein